jgi:hypothetical protein
MAFPLLSKLRPRAITHRHDRLVQVLASLFRVGGGLVHVEAKAPGEERLRPDLEVILPDQRLLVDIAVVHPASEAKRSYTALAATRTIELRKADKYRDLAGGDARVLGFVLETYGAFGNEAAEVLKILRTCLSRTSLATPSMTYRTMVEMVAVSLQRGNATISSSGSAAVRRPSAAQS